MYHGAGHLTPQPRQPSERCAAMPLATTRGRSLARPTTVSASRCPLRPRLAMLQRTSAARLISIGRDGKSAFCETR
eukprot:3476554-Lingulodinium_polyedra.AAC.1